MALALPDVSDWGGLSQILGTSPVEWVPLFRLAGMEEAVGGDLCVLPSQASPLQIRACRAAVLVGTSQQREHLGKNSSTTFLVVPEPTRVFWELLDGPCRPAQSPEDWMEEREVVDRFGVFSRTAMVHRAASVGRGVFIGAGAVIHARVDLADRVSVGEGCVLGAAGFGFVSVGGAMRQLPHWAGVEVGDGTTFGPQCQVSAGLLSPTRIGRNCHFDAQIQVGHNCQVGDGCLVAGQSGLAGSVVLGSHCLVGGQAGISDHVQLGDRCVVAARAGVTRSWPPETVLRGFPARPGRAR
ncbi:MAG: hypothetical protein IPN71_15980 [Fibrobacteres bacterium]|nr:hypothetical protein [Fibrobacterota bacterium]